MKAIPFTDAEWRDFGRMTLHGMPSWQTLRRIYATIDGLMAERDRIKAVALELAGAEMDNPDHPTRTVELVEIRAERDTTRIASVCACGNNCTWPWVICTPCYFRGLYVKERRQFDAAEKVSWRDYKGPVRTTSNGFWRSVGEMTRYYGDARAPLYVWACDVIRLRLDVDAMITAAIEAAATGHKIFNRPVSLAAVEELQEVVDAWSAQHPIESTTPDYSKAVLLDGFFGGAEKATDDD